MKVIETGTNRMSVRIRAANSNLVVVFTVCEISRPSSQKSAFFVVFAVRCYDASVVYAVMQCLSVRPSVCSWTPSKRINIIIFKRFSPSRRELLHHSSFSQRLGNIPTGTPNGGVECRWGRQKSRFETSIWLSIDDCWSYCDQQLTVVRALVYNS